MEKAPRIQGVLWKKRLERNHEVVIVKEANRSGTFLSISAKGLGRSKEVHVPELVENHGWGMLVEKIRRFAMENNSEKSKSYKSFKEVASIPPRPDLEIRIRPESKHSGVDFSVEEESCRSSFKFLERCLVGRVGDLDCPIPAKAELQKWVDQRWKTTGGVRMVDMNGKFFLFEFPSKEEVGKILREKNWFVSNEPLLLDRWNPVGGCHHNERKRKEAWTRALGLPIHLWRYSVFKKIGRRCGGFIGG